MVNHPHCSFSDPGFLELEYSTNKNPFPNRSQRKQNFLLLSKNGFLTPENSETLRTNLTLKKKVSKLAHHFLSRLAAPFLSNPMREQNPLLFLGRGPVLLANQFSHTNSKKKIPNLPFQLWPIPTGKHFTHFSELPYAFSGVKFERKKPLTTHRTFFLFRDRDKRFGSSLALV